MSDLTRVKTILILAANPTNTSRLRLDEEVREIEEGLRRGNLRARFKVEQKWAVRSRDFYRAILDTQPQIVHFCGHGALEDGLVLESDTGQVELARADELASMFRLFATECVECVVLNACYSQTQAEAIRQHINYVIGTNRTIGERSSVTFATAFYDALAAGRDIQVITLEDFTPEQVTDINHRHGRPLNSNEEWRLIGLLGGQPYLVRRALYLVANRLVSPDELFANATADNGSFGDHLRHYLSLLHGKTELIQGLLEVIRQNTCTDKRIFWRLRGAGLVREEGRTVQPRCQLYANYFRENLRE